MVFWKEVTSRLSLLMFYLFYEMKNYVYVLLIVIIIENNNLHSITIRATDNYTAYKKSILDILVFICIVYLTLKRRHVY